MNGMFVNTNKKLKEFLNSRNEAVVKSIKRRKEMSECEKKRHCETSRIKTTSSGVTSFAEFYSHLYVSASPNGWSQPVVVPIEFYEKLECYVADFNKKLNNCGD